MPRKERGLEDEDLQEYLEEKERTRKPEQDKDPLLRVLEDPNNQEMTFRWDTSQKIQPWSDQAVEKAFRFAGRSKLLDVFPTVSIFYHIADRESRDPASKLVQGEYYLLLRNPPMVS